jgi:prepilin-type N-terminal cleavage/methylation domain-containing protein
MNQLPRRRAFTLVEMLVVIAVIVALMGLLLAGLQSAQRTSKRTKAASDIRQVGQAWMQYASTYGDACLPGYLDDEVQASWKVRYKDKSGDRVPAQYARTYPYRLLPYLDHSPEVLYGYLEATDDFAYTVKTAEGDPNDAGMAVASTQPAFGYNAYYLGGWWTSQGSGPDATPTLTFGNATWNASGGTTVTGRVVANRVGGVNQPDLVICFASSIFRQPGFYKDESEERAIGAAWIVPARLGETEVWRPSVGEAIGVQLGGGALAGTLFGPPLADLAGRAIPAATGALLEVLAPQAVPLRRFGPACVSVQVDGSVDFLSIGDLQDMRRWMNPALSGQGNPNDFGHSD